MSSRFPTLAAEVVQIVADALDPTDILSVRLVCQELHKKTHHAFNLVFFSIVRTDLTPKSLQRLRTITESQSLAQTVESLHIGSLDGFLGRGFQWPRDLLGHLVAPLEGADLLRDVLVKLVKCRSFHIDSWDEYEQRDDIDCLIPGDVVGIVLSIIAETHLAVESFSVITAHSGSARLEGKRLQMPLRYQPRFIAAWAHLKILVLEYGITSDQYDWVLDLITHAPRLQKLSLCFYDHLHTFMKRLVSATSLARLEDLRFRSASMTVDALSELLLQHRESLRAINFNFLALQDGGRWATVFELMEGKFPLLQSVSVFWLREKRSSEEGARVVLAKLTDYPAVPGSEIRRPGDGRLKFDSRQLGPVDQIIKLRYWGKVESVVGVSYQGSEMDQFLTAIAVAAKAQ